MFSKYPVKFFFGGISISEMEYLKDEIRPASAVLLLFARALKPVQPEVRKGQNAIGSFSSALTAAFQGGQAEPTSGW